MTVIEETKKKNPTYQEPFNEELESLLSKLISFKTVTSDKEENKRLLDWVAGEIGPFFYVERFERNGHHSLIATTRKTKTPKVFLYCHVDVVPGSDSLFSMRTVGDKLLGRGTMDMKFALACYLKLIKDMGEKIKDLDIGLMLVSDEEVGGYNGVNYLIEQGFVAPVIFIPDGGYDWNIESQAKGIVWFCAKSQGKSSHGSRPWDGVDPFDPLFHFLNDLKKLFVQEPCGDPTHAHHTMTVGKIEGGSVFNQVAPSAEAYIDIRFVPTSAKEEIEQMVQNIAQQHPLITLEVVESESSFKTRTDHPAVASWVRTAKRMVGVHPSFVLAHGGSDARYFDPTLGVLITTPICGDYHTEEEWIDRKSLAEFYQVMREWIAKTA